MVSSCVSWNQREQVLEIWRKTLFSLNKADQTNKKGISMSLQGLGGLQSLDLSLNGLSSIPLGLLDELQSLRYPHICTNYFTPTCFLFSQCSHTNPQSNTTIPWQPQIIKFRIILSMGWSKFMDTSDMISWKKKKLENTRRKRDWTQSESDQKRMGVSRPDFFWKSKE